MTRYGSFSWIVLLSSLALNGCGASDGPSLAAAPASTPTTTPSPTASALRFSKDAGDFYTYECNLLRLETTDGTSVGADTVVNLSAPLQSGGASSAVLYADHACTGSPITSMTIPKGGIQSLFYLRDTVDENVNVHGTVTTTPPAAPADLPIFVLTSCC